MKKNKWTILQWGKPHLTDKQIDAIIDAVENRLTYEGRGDDITGYVSNEDRQTIKRKIKIIIGG